MTNKEMYQMFIEFWLKHGLTKEEVKDKLMNNAPFFTIQDLKFNLKYPNSIKDKEIEKDYREKLEVLIELRDNL